MRHLHVTLVLAVGFVLAVLLVGQAQPLSVLQGRVLTQDGKPVTNQPLVIEGRKESPWVNLGWLTRKEVRVMSVTDQQGVFQVINLPPGHYALKLLRPGAEPVLVREFNLDHGYDRKEIVGSVPAGQLGREQP